MSDERPVATDALKTLGTIIDDTAKRDAIHLAVIPAVAGARFAPGAHVVVYNGVSRAPLDGHGVGIVDPFLTRAVLPGERFWLVIYPRTIQSLRHVWTHPAFPDEADAGSAPEGSGDEYVPPAIVELRKKQSEKWLRDFCDRNDCPSYEVTLGLAASNDSHDYLLVRGDSAHAELSSQFWDHVEVVLGRKLAHRPTYFSCTC